MSRHYLEKMERVTTFLFDVDGVLSDGSVVLIPGDQARTMYVRDGYALQLAVKMGYRVGIISGGKSEQVRARLEGLGVKDIFLSEHNKLDRLESYAIEHDLSMEEILYMGDDIPDYQVMKQVGIACCPKNADHEIKEICDYISPKDGGKGCVRDVIEKVMRLQEKWFSPEKAETQFKEFFW